MSTRLVRIIEPVGKIKHPVAIFESDKVPDIGDDVPTEARMLEPRCFKVRSSSDKTKHYTVELRETFGESISVE